MRRGQGHVYSMCVSVYTSVFAPDRPGRLPRAGAQTRGAGLPIGHRTPRRARPAPRGAGGGRTLRIPQQAQPQERTLSLQLLGVHVL